MKEMKEWELHRGFLLDSAKGFDVIDCEQCGFKHIIPIPTSNVLESVYRQEYYSTEKPLYLARYREDLEWWNLVYGDRYDVFEKHLPGHRRRILDIGSGPGYFLLHGKERGWDTLGIEPSKQAAAHSKALGLEIIEDFLDEACTDQLGKFDVVHMSEVLEHIPDPIRMLEMAGKLLNDDGFLCVVVPNDYNPFQDALRKECGYEPWWLAPPHHVNYFDFDSLSLLLRKTGFEEFLKEATFPIDMFLLMGYNYVGDDEAGRFCHNKRKTFEINLTRAGQKTAKRELYKAFAEQGIGREVVFYARKGAKKIDKKPMRG